MAQQKRILTGIQEDTGLIPGLARGLRIRRCCELWYRLQTRLRSGVAAAIVQASGYIYNSTPNLGPSICRGCSPRKKKKRI